MALKLIGTVGTGTVVVKVYRDAEWHEYRARLYIDGKLHGDADVHDDDKDSVFDTAHAMVRQGREQMDIAPTPCAPHTLQSVAYTGRELKC